MAVSYPDIIGEHIATPERFVTGGLQYAGYVDPPKIRQGQAANLFLFLQNVLDVPLTVKLKIDIPKKGWLFRKPLLFVESQEFEIELSEAEAGLLTLPVTTTAQTKGGQHTLTIEPKVSAKGKGKRIRPPKSKSKLDDKFIDSMVGLNLVSYLGSTYVEKSTKKAAFTITVAGQKKSSKKLPPLEHHYEKIWGPDSAEIFNKAIREINSRRAKFQNELTIEALYVNLYGESVKRFANVGLQLRIGEAITMAKILTYSSQYFLSSPNRTNGLLVPIWERALEYEVDTTDSLEVIRRLGFHHLLKLSVAMSFGIIAQAVGRQLWSLPERQAVATYIADALEIGDKLDQEFLYLPLLMAGTQISNKLSLSGEDVGHSLALMNKARQARAELFTDDDMTTANKVYDQILADALK